MPTDMKGIAMEFSEAAQEDAGLAAHLFREKSGLDIKSEPCKEKTWHELREDMYDELLAKIEQESVRTLDEEAAMQKAPRSRSAFSIHTECC